MPKKLPSPFEAARGVCGSCRFWRRYDSETQEQVETGECRRYPATAFMVLVDGEPEFGSEFPQHDQEDWCGEFAPSN